MPFRPGVPGVPCTREKEEEGVGGGEKWEGKERDIFKIISDNMKHAFLTFFPGRPILPGGPIVPFSPGGPTAPSNPYEREREQTKQ